MGVNLGYVVEMEPTRVKFKIWSQHGIPELNGVNSRLNISITKTKLMRKQELVYSEKIC